MQCSFNCLSDIRGNEVGLTLNTSSYATHGRKSYRLAVELSEQTKSQEPQMVQNSEKVNNNRKSITRFPMSLRWTSYVARQPRKGGLETAVPQNCLFPSKIALCLKKVWYTVLLCENCQPQSCRALIGLTNRAKMIGGGDPFYLKFVVKLTGLERNRRFSIYFRS